MSLASEPGIEFHHPILNGVRDRKPAYDGQTLAALAHIYSETELTMAQAVDIYATSIYGVSMAEWARKTGRSPRTIRGNVSAARDNLAKDRRNNGRQ